MSLDKDLFKIDGFEISFHEKSKRIINIKIKEEIIKRIIKQFFIPTLVLIASLIILFNKDQFNYSKIQYILFFIGSFCCLF